MSTSKKIILGSNALIVTCAVLLLLGFLQAISMQNRVQIDVSRNAQNTLEGSTLQKLQQLTQGSEELRITAFSTKPTMRDSAQKKSQLLDLLKLLKRHCPELSYSYVDFDGERLTAEKLNVKEYGRVVIERGNARIDIRERDLFTRKKTGLIFNGESQFSKAFSQLLQGYAPKVYLLQGHSEPSIENTSGVGLSQWAQLLEQERIAVRSLNMLQEGKSIIPGDAAVVALVDPTQPLAQVEQEALKSYLAGGGRLLLALDVATTDLPLLEELGMRVEQGIAADVRTMFPHWDRPIPLLKRHEITQTLIEQQVPVVLSAPVPLVQKPIQGIIVHPLMHTSKQGWIERGNNKEFDADIDKKGEVNLGYAIELTTASTLLRKGMGQARVVLFSDSDLLSNGLLKEVPGNAPLILNTLQWLIGSNNYQAAGKKIELETLAIARPQLPTLRFLSLVPLPLLTVIIGFAVWWSRRGR